MKVLVTGATGFVAGHCVEELLTHGYQVRGTVRNLRTADVTHLRAIAERTGGELEFVEADLTADAGWAEAVAGCAYVWHVASPFPSRQPRDEHELITPAVDGTLRVLRAAHDAGVRRVVLTSSLAAIAFGHDDNSRTYTEADWTDVSTVDAYVKSKTLAERAAWEFARDSGLELVAVNPGTIFGPLQNTDCSTSLVLIRRLMAGGLPVVPKIGWATVDVRDLARLHRLAMESPAAAGNRYVAGGRHVWAREMASVLAERYRPSGYRIGTGPMPYALMWLISRVDPSVRLALTFWDRLMLVSADKAETELGWTMRPVEESVTDTAESMIQHGLVPPRPRRTR
ncbi:SDR family oxidoreductase [Dactylosporangium sp. CA-092794]|uniref:SDR family oxidoreductase n=1 Tax=Dactylosporangium sp. CA-092794 TaxID=3239929 RepID=UPI003D8F15C6